MMTLSWGNLRNCRRLMGDDPQRTALARGGEQTVIHAIIEGAEAAERGRLDPPPDPNTAIMWVSAGNQQSNGIGMVVKVVADGGIV